MSQELGNCLDVLAKLVISPLRESQAAMPAAIGGPEPVLGGTHRCTPQQRTTGPERFPLRWSIIAFQ